MPKGTKTGLLLGWTLFFFVGPARAEAIRCPSTITVRAEADHGAGWSAKPTTSLHPFQGISLLAGSLGVQDEPAPPLLAPRQETKGTTLIQRWPARVDDENPLVLVCHYRDTEVTLARSLPAGLEECTQVLHSAPDAQPTMLCH